MSLKTVHITMPRPDHLCMTRQARHYEELMPLTVEALAYTAKSRRLIDNLDLYISSSGVTVILGPNGAGKSLLLRLIHGLIKADSGTIQWGRRTINDTVRSYQSLVFQKPALLRRSVKANLEFVLNLRRIPQSARRCNELLGLVNLQSHARQSARSLSAGEQQRLALARSLAIEPLVLMLDEPTASLDPASTEVIEKSVLQQKRQGVKVIFITHDLGQAQRIADDIVFMHRGRVVENATAQTFFNHPDTDIAQAYLSGQLIL